MAEVYKEKGKVKGKEEENDVFKPSLGELFQSR